MHLVRYTFKRIGISLVTIFVVITLTFFLMNAMPGDPFIGNKAVPEAIKESLYKKYGLDKPILQRYTIYLGNLAKGDFGMSMMYKNRNVGDIIKVSFPVSADLGIRALIFGVFVGLLLGILAALHHNKTIDRVSMFIAIIGVSLPALVVGATLQYLLGYQLSSFVKDLFNTTYQLIPISRWEGFKYTILPSLALGLSALASISRLMRTTMLDVINQDYIKTAKAKGLSQSRVVVNHMIRNAILPVITVLGPMIAAILTGSFVIEQIFAIPGLGKFFVSSVQMNDYTMIMGLTLFYASFIIIMNMIVDILYGVIDPRIRLAKGRA